MNISIAEANLMDLTDEQVITEVATTIETIHKLNELKKTDEEIAEAKRQLKILEERKYNLEIRTLKQRFKALRALAHHRGVRFPSVFDLTNTNEES